MLASTTYPTAGQHPISAVLLTQSFHLVTSRTLGNLRKSRAIILSLSFASPTAFPLNHPLCHRTRRGNDDAAGSGGARLTGWIASVCCCGWQREKLTAHARTQLSHGEPSPDWSLVWVLWVVLFGSLLSFYTFFTSRYDCRDLICMDVNMSLIVCDLTENIYILSFHDW